MYEIVFYICRVILNSLNFALTQLLLGYPTTSSLLFLFNSLVVVYLLVKEFVLGITTTLSIYTMRSIRYGIEI